MQSRVGNWWFHHKTHVGWWIHQSSSLHIVPFHHNATFMSHFFRISMYATLASKQKDVNLLFGILCYTSSIKKQTKKSATYLSNIKPQIPWKWDQLRRLLTRTRTTGNLSRESYLPDQGFARRDPDPSAAMGVRTRCELWSRSAASSSLEESSSDPPAILQIFTKRKKRKIREKNEKGTDRVLKGIKEKPKATENGEKRKGGDLRDERRRCRSGDCESRRRLAFFASRKRAEALTDGIK